jgi:hypothetical protein
MVVWSDGTPRSIHSSYRAARSAVRSRAGTVYMVKGGGLWWGYPTRADMARDTHGNSAYRVSVTIRPEATWGEDAP